MCARENLCGVAPNLATPRCRLPFAVCTDLATCKDETPAACTGISGVNFQTACPKLCGICGTPATVLTTTGKVTTTETRSAIPFDPICGGGLGDTCKPQGKVCVDGGTTNARCVDKATATTAAASTCVDKSSCAQLGVRGCSGPNYKAFRNDCPTTCYKASVALTCVPCLRWSAQQEGST